MMSASESMAELRRIFGFNAVKKNRDMYYVTLRSSDIKLMSTSDGDKIIKSPIVQELREFSDALDIDAYSFEGGNRDHIHNKDGSAHSGETFACGLRIAEKELEKAETLENLCDFTTHDLSNKYGFLNELVTLNAGFQADNDTILDVLDNWSQQTKWKYDEDTRQFVTMEKVKTPKNLLQTIEYGMDAVVDKESMASLARLPDGPGYARLPETFCKRYLEELNTLVRKNTKVLESLQPSEPSLRRSEP